MEIYMVHDLHGATHVYSEQEALALEPRGWKRGKLPEPEKVVVEAPAEVEQDDIESLRAKATALGIKVDGRWKVERLEEEIKAAE